nr:stage III sporulation protein AG [uncultured Oscillibacter sp.]
MKEKTEGARKIWNKYKYAALVALIGAGLLLWPGLGNGVSRPEREDQSAQTAGSGWDLQAVQREMEEILGAMDGVGQAKVMLTVDSDGERQLAQDTQLSYSGDTAAPEDYSRKSETVRLDGSGGDEAVVVRTTYPTYRGALVVCQGGGSAEVRLAVTGAVAALTGLPTDRVTVAKWQ